MAWRLRFMTKPDMMGASSQDMGGGADELRPLTHSGGWRTRVQGFMRCHQIFTNRSGCRRRAASGSETFSREPIRANVEGE